MCGCLRRIKRVCLRGCLENIAGIVYKDSPSRADINRQRPSLRKQSNVLALGASSHGTHSLSSVVTQPRTEFCRSTGFLSLIGAARGVGGPWTDWLRCSVNHPRIAPTQTWVHLVLNNCRNQCFPYKERKACVTSLKSGYIQNAIYNLFKIKTHVPCRLTVFSAFFLCECLPADYELDFCLSGWLIHQGTWQMAPSTTSTKPSAPGWLRASKCPSPNPSQASPTT